MTSIKKIQGLIEEPISGEWGEEGKGVKVIRTTNFRNDGRLDLAEVVERSIEPQKVAKKRLQIGDIILEKSGGSPKQPVGRVVYFDIESDDTFLCNNFTAIIRSKGEVNSKYLFWFLYYNHLTKQTLKYQNKTTGILNLRLNNYLGSIAIPDINSSKQEQIVRIIDEADKLRQVDNLLLEEYENLIQNVFREMFVEYVGQVDSDKSLGEFIEVNPKKSELKIEADLDVSFVPMSAVGEHGEFDCSITKLWSEVKQGFTYFKENDVLFAKITPCMENGKGAIAKGLMNGIGFGSTEFHVLRPNEQFLPEFIYSLLSQKWIREFAESSMTGSAGQKRVPVDFFKRIKLKKPPMDLQRKYQSIYNKITELKSIANQSKIESENLFQSLLQKSFNS